jgi:hypothetical protein
VPGIGPGAQSVSPVSRVSPVSPGQRIGRAAGSEARDPAHRAAAPADAAPDTFPADLSKIFDYVPRPARQGIDCPAHMQRYRHDAVSGTASGAERRPIRTFIVGFHAPLDTMNVARVRLSRE